MKTYIIGQRHIRSF